MSRFLMTEIRAFKGKVHLNKENFQTSYYLLMGTDNLGWAMLISKLENESKALN